MATTDNKQNCRIGWITDKGGISIKITLVDNIIIYERKGVNENRDYTKACYTIWDSWVIGELYKQYPHHTLWIELQNHKNGEV